MVDEALGTVQQTEDTDIATENNVNVIINCWNKLFKKDPTITKYKALEALKKFR